MSKQDIEKRLGFAAQGVKETTRTSAKAEFIRFIDLETWKDSKGTVFTAGIEEDSGNRFQPYVTARDSSGGDQLRTLNAPVFKTEKGARKWLSTWLQNNKSTSSRPGAKAKMALTISTVGAKNLCYEALANLGELTKLAAQTNSGWDFHVNVMINHVKDAIARMETKPTQAATDLDKAVDTLGMLKKIEPKRLNDIQKGSFKQLIGYVAKSLRDAKANIKLVTTASRPGAKAKMSKTEAVEDVVNALYIAERKIQAMMQEGQRGNLSLVKKDIDYLRGVSAAIKQRIEKFESTGFSRPGVKAKFADTALNQIRNNAAISDKILTLVSKGLSVPQAIDSVLGEGTYKRIGSEVYDELKKAKSSRPGVKAKMAAEIASDPRDKDFEKLKTLKGVVHQGKGFYIIPGKLMTPERRTKVKRSTQRYELSNMGDLVGWGTNHPNVNDYRLKDWAEAFA